MKNSFSRDKIEHLLKFPEEDIPELHQAAKDENLMLFLGAGLAKMYGCLLWDEMAKELSKTLRKNKIISYAQEDILVKEAENDPRKVLSICYSFCNNDKEKSSIYIKAIKDAVKIKEEEYNHLRTIYELIFSLEPTVYLTTNIDLGIKSYLKQYSSLNTNPNQRIYNCTLRSDQEVIRQLSYKIFKDSNIIYLHGNEEHMEESILTVENYLEYYSDKQGFLRNLFSNIDVFVIFVGYGLKEWDVIEKIYKINKSNLGTAKKEITSCLLTPIYSHEITKFNLEQTYYKSFGVRPIPYLIDDNGYSELLRVLKNLKEALDSNRPLIYDVVKKIEEI